MPAASPAVPRLAAEDAELLEAIYGYARRRVADRAAAEELTLAVLRQAGLGTGSRVDRAGAFQAIAEAVRATDDAALRDPDGLAIELFALSLEPDLRDGFERLELERRRVLTLHYLDGLGPLEMAAVLGTRAVAVQSRLAASLRELQRGGSARNEAISAA
jgi:hypothetical protein